MLLRHTWWLFGELGRKDFVAWLRAVLACDPSVTIQRSHTTAPKAHQCRTTNTWKMTLKNKKPQTIRYLAFLYVPLSNKKMTLNFLRSGCLVPNNTERKLRFNELELSESLVNSFRDSKCSTDNGSVVICLVAWLREIHQVTAQRSHTAATSHRSQKLTNAGQLTLGKWC